MPETTEAGVDARFRLTWREYFAAERFLLRQRQRFEPEQFVGVGAIFKAGSRAATASCL
jgi:hypothetical protein